MFGLLTKKDEEWLRTIQPLDKIKKRLMTDAEFIRRNNRSFKLRCMLFLGGFLFTEEVRFNWRLVSCLWRCLKVKAHRWRVLRALREAAKANQK